MSHFQICSSPREPWFKAREIVFKMETPAELKIRKEKPKAAAAGALPRICLQEAAFGGAINIYFLCFLETEVVCHLLEPH